MVEKDAAKRANLLAEIMDGIAGPNGWYWRDEAETRLRCLQEDAPVFGLMPHERDEMRALIRLLRQNPPPSPMGGEDSPKGETK